MMLEGSFSNIFWISYICGGVSDAIDGFVARTWNIQSQFGAKLDSIADVLYAFSIFLVAIRNIMIPTWLWVCILMILFTRCIAYGIGFYKFHAFVALHTYANKISGFFLFLFPLFYMQFGIIFTGIFLCLLSFLSSLEELMMIMKSKDLNRNSKSIFIR